MGYACSEHSARDAQLGPSHHNERQIEQDDSEGSLGVISSSAGTNAAISETKSLDPDQSQKPRRARASKPKVKTDCNNCK